MAEQKHDPKNSTDVKQEPAATQTKHETAPARLPFLVEFTHSVTKVIVLLVGLVTGIISIVSGATLIDTVLRSAAAMFALGLLLWLVNYYISKNSLEIVRIEMLHEIKQQEAQDKSASTFEKAA